jgi:hypothetical protein
MRITWAVLEAAKDAGDERVIAACRRTIAADRIGWRKHGNPSDLELVYCFAVSKPACEGDTFRTEFLASQIRN